MKSSVLVLVTLLLIGSVSAQETRIGFKAGVNLPYIKISASGETLSGGNTGFHVGGMAQLKFSETFSVQPALLFNYKQADLQQFEFESYHVDLPINLLYTHSNFFIGGGPNVSYAISGKAKTENEKVDMFDEEEAQTLTHKRLDLGMNLTMGYNFPGGLQVSSFYTAGINNIYKGNGEVEDVTTRTRNFGFSVGYLFDLKKKK